MIILSSEDVSSPERATAVIYRKDQVFCLLYWYDQIQGG